MRVPVTWLREHCDPPLSTAALADRLTMTGTKVEAVHAHGVADPAGFVVGRVLAAEPHPDADRLRVCAVDVGDASPLQIVCGAPNVAAGQSVPVARPGAVLPDGVRLGQASLRGVASEGMILAEDELAIGADHTGILVLGENGGGPEPGTPLEQVLAIATDVLELEITPNRPDCLGVYGVAREVHAVTGAALGPPPWAQDPMADGPGGAGAAIGVTVTDPVLCPRFTARLFEGVRIGPSPRWLKARLAAAGQRPISNVVDITNYVMLLTGQPLHAFDADRIAGATLEVRRARAGEELETLDGARRPLDPSMVAIADADGVTSLAGIMGGARSEVAASTTRVLMEAATWDGPTLQGTAAALTLRSEASARFEKGLAPEATLEAQAVAARLMVELCGAQPAGGTTDVGGAPPAPAAIRLRDAAVTRLLGAPVPRPRARQILEALEFAVVDAPDGLDAAPPPFRRADVTREADLIEEVARVDGLDRLPETLPAVRGARGGLTAGQAVRRRVEDALADRGVHEILGWSFAPVDHDDRLGLGATDPRRVGHVGVVNPMAADQGRLRTGVLGSLLDAAGHNHARGQRELRLFEAGNVYAARIDTGTDVDALACERRHLGVVLTGPARPPTWREPRPPPADLFAAKGLLAALGDDLRVELTLEPGEEPFLHPGRSARVIAGDRALGWLGELHPRVAAAWDLDRVAGFEIDLDALVELAVASTVPVYRDLASFPAVREDLAVVIDDDVPVARVLAAVRAAAGDTLERAEIFDVYRGAQVGEGKVSLALALAFRAADRTLTDEEVAERRAAILEALAAQLGARPRG